MLPHAINARAIIDLIGKHGRIRSVPMPEWTKAAIDKWSAAGGVGAGHVFRPISRASRLMRSSLNEKCVWSIVRKCLRPAAATDCRVKGISD
jgi:hypothetical protein